MHYGSLLGGSRADQFQLNCGPVGHISPDSAMRFEMRMELGAEVRLGPHTLNWYLSDARIRRASAQTQFEMTS
jgi:hypothetical protein